MTTSVSKVLWKYRRSAVGRQKIDQDQPERMGDAHVVRGLVCELPFAVPFERLVAAGSLELPDEVFDR
jgi:hypothetical protein